MPSDLRDDPEQGVDASDDQVATTNGRVPAARRKRSKSATGQNWSRLVHVYTSMVCFLVVLFFSVTGLTLNHPTWTLFGGPSEATESGTFPADWKSADGQVDWLVVDEYLRSQYDLRGSVTDHQATGSSGSISYRGPGFGADSFFDTDAGTYDITITHQGSLGFLNDLHKGRDTRRSWAWLIDASAIFLIVISLSGLILQLFLKRRRRAAVIGAAIGGVILIAFMVLAAR